MTEVTVSTSSTSTKNATQKIVDTIDKCVQKRIQEAAFDTTYTGVITKINFDKNTDVNDKTYNNYTVKFNGVERDFYIKDANIHSVGEVVRVHIPKNNPTSRYVEVLKNNQNEHPYNIEYNETNETITEFWCNDSEAVDNYFNNQTPIDETKITQTVYTLTVENKGTEDEKVTQIEFPDGSLMKITGF